MHPRAVVQPVGPRPARVYWVRRTALAAAFVLLVVLLAHACGGNGDTSPRTLPRAETLPVASATPAVDPTPTTARVRARVAPCRPGSLEVTASTDATDYPGAAMPRLAATVRNTSRSACRYDPAPAARSWRILSGTDEVWSTSDCARSAAARPLRLRAGASVSYAVVWDRHRSVTGCAAPGRAAQPGTYRLYVSVMGSPSAAAIFHLAG